MALLASDKGGGDFEPIPEGIHPAVCYGVYDLGNQWSEGSKEGKSWAKWTQKVLIQWELPLQRIEYEGEDRPKATSRIFTLSLDKKSNLRPFLQGWRGKSFTVEELEGFDISKLLGVNCQLQIIHAVVGDNTYANIQAAIPATKKYTPENQTILFAIEDTVIPEGTPEWIANKIMESKEWGDREEISDEPSKYGPRDDFPGPSDDEFGGYTDEDEPPPF